MDVRARRLLGRWLPLTLALVAIAFVAWIVPVRDRCWDPRAPQSTRVAVTHEAGGGCVLHLKTSDVPIDPGVCSALRCEPGVASTFARARVGVLGALALLYAAGTLAWAARWRALLGFAGIDLPLGRVWRVCVEAQAGGILLPGGIGGDALRVALVAARPTRAGEERQPVSIVVASVLLDRAVGLSTVAGVAAALGFAYGGLRGGPLAAVLAAIPIACAAGWWTVRRAPVERLARLSGARAGGILDRLGGFGKPVLEYVRHPRATSAALRALAISVVVAGMQFAIIRGLIFALGETPVHERWVYVGTAMAFIVGAVPALPGGWGTTDAAYVFFFGLAGLPAGTALAVSLLYRLFWYATGATGAVLHWAGANARSPVPSPVPSPETRP